MSGGGWAQTGFDSADTAEEEYGGSGGDGGSNRVFPYFTPYVPQDKGGPLTKLILLLDDVPWCFWEHGLYAFTKARDKEICLARNKIHESCPLCDVAQEKKSWPSFVGKLTVIDCGEIIFGPGEDEKERPEIKQLKGWTNDKGNTYQFGKKLLSVNKGGKDKPGLLPKLRRLKELKGGSLVGTLWAVTRTASLEETPGTDWNFRGRVDVSTLAALKNSLVNLPGSPLSGPDDPIIKWLESADPINYSEMFVPSSVDVLAKIAGTGGGYKPSPPPNNSDTGSKLGDQDDDIPF